MTVEDYSNQRILQFLENNKHREIVYIKFVGEKRGTHLITTDAGRKITDSYVQEDYKSWPPGIIIFPMRKELINGMTDYVFADDIHQIVERLRREANAIEEITNRGEWT